MKLKSVKLYLKTVLFSTVIMIGGTLFFAYGPVDYFRDIYITSAMRTMSNKWLATSFYDEKTILKSLANNIVLEPNQSTEPEKIKTAETPKLSDSDPLAQTDMTKPYKIIDISGVGYKGHLIAIYEPKKIELGVTRSLYTLGEKLSPAAKREKARFAVNASGFVDIDGHGNGGTPTGIVIQNGKIICDPEPGASRSIIGFNKEGILILEKLSAADAIKKGVTQAVEFGPYLIVNGESAITKGNGGWGTAPRTAVGQRKDGIVLFLIIDGRQPTHSVGVTLVDLIEIMKKYGAYNAANLDGGSSTTLAIEGELYNKPSTPAGERYLPNWFMVK